jgi:hypothetical protein
MKHDKGSTDTANNQLFGTILNLQGRYHFAVDRNTQRTTYLKD